MKTTGRQLVERTRREREGKSRSSEFQEEGVLGGEEKRGSVEKRGRGIN